MSKTILAQLEELGEANRARGERVLKGIRQRARRQRIIRLWAGRFLVLTGYVALTGLVVALMMGL